MKFISIVCISATAAFFMSVPTASAFVSRFYPPSARTKPRQQLKAEDDTDSTTLRNENDTLMASGEDNKSSNTMIVKNIPTGEIKEVPFYDPYMEANTDATMISPWAVLLFGFPTILLLNDAFHFLPNDGVFGQLQETFR